MSEAADAAQEARKARRSTGQIQPRGGSVRDVQKAFDRRAIIDNISSVKAQDLEVEKKGDGGFDVHALYTVRVPLFGNVNACIDFDVTNGK